MKILIIDCVASRIEFSLLRYVTYHMYDILYVSCLFLVGSLKCITCDEGDKCKTGNRMGCKDGYVLDPNEGTFTCIPCKPGN